MPRILVEDDRVLRLLGIVLDPQTPADRVEAWADFVAHDEPDFAAWLSRVRSRLPAVFPASVTFAASPQDFASALPAADAVVTESFAIGRAEIESASRLALVQKFGQIATNIDLVACAENALPVKILRRRQNIAVAEHAFMLIAALARRLCELNGLVQADKLAEAGFDPTPFDRRYMANSNFARVPGLKTLHGSVVGIVGMGEIGREVASRCAAFGMRVLYFQRTRLPDADGSWLSAEHCPLAELFARADFVSLHLPLNDSTRGIIDAAVLARAKPGSFLVNTARADLVERRALIEALDTGRLAGFALDTGYSEPAAADETLLGRPNVLLTPHTAPAGRRNGLDDIEEICLNLQEALAARAG